jgi:hypothetical protein
LAVLFAGAGRAEIFMPPEMFPFDGYTSVHDTLNVRVLLLKGDVGLAIVSFELISPPEDTNFRKLVSEIADIPLENIWFCASHTFSAPHLFSDHSLLKKEDQKKLHIFRESVKSALFEATRKAISGMRQARFGCEFGFCDVNVNRDIYTEKGWWLGRNESGPSDKTLTVLKVEALDGHVIGFLLSFPVQASVMNDSVMSDGGRMVSGDLFGVTSRYLEREYQGAVALFCVGAAGDQAPILKARYNYVNRYGELCERDIHERGFVLVEELGVKLAESAVLTIEKINCCFTEPLYVTRSLLKCPAKKMVKDIRLLSPSKSFDFKPVGEREVTVEIMLLGDLALVGVRPELCCITAQQIRNGSPFTKTTVLTMVNGGAKYMPDETSYDRITYEAMNSPFARVLPKWCGMKPSDCSRLWLRNF